jgi:hypothetical protein
VSVSLLKKFTNACKRAHLMNVNRYSNIDLALAAQLTQGLLFMQINP